jgi:hypothetical protein
MASRSRIQNLAESLWIKALTNNPFGNRMPYDMRLGYKSNDCIDHPEFGVGVVQRACTSHITVLFRYGEKRLAQNMRSSA